MRPGRVFGLSFLVKRLDEEEYRPHPRPESRRLVQGGRGRTGKSPRSVPLNTQWAGTGRAVIRAERPPSGGKKSGTAEVCAFVSLYKRQGRFLLYSPRSAGFSLLSVWLMIYLISRRNAVHGL